MEKRRVELPRGPGRRGENADEDRPEATDPHGNGFRTAEVARILSVSPARVRAAVRGGLCRPGRHGRRWKFSFQDLVVLRTAQGLLKANIPPRRIRRALANLRRQIAAFGPLSGVRIYADGDRVVARQGRTTWQPESGQVVFTFDVNELAGAARLVLPRGGRGRPSKPGRATSPAPQALAFFQRALRLEDQGRLAEAVAAYTRAVELNPRMADAYINLGRIAHERGRPADAALLYHRALTLAPHDAIAHYDYALASEDLNEIPRALAHYRRAVKIDPAFADAHFNLGSLLERLGRRAQAERHLVTYRRLTARE